MGTHCCMAGISVDASRHVALSGCWVRTADDAVVVKSSASTQPPTLNITATNLTLQSRSAAVRVGGCVQQSGCVQAVQRSVRVARGSGWVGASVV